MRLRDLFRMIKGWRPEEPDYLRMDIENRLKRLDMIIELQERDRDNHHRPKPMQQEPERS